MNAKLDRPLSAIVVEIIQIFNIWSKALGILKRSVVGGKAFNFLHDVRVMIFVCNIKKSVEGGRSFQEFIPSL